MTGASACLTRPPGQDETATPSTYVLSGTIQYSGRTLQVASAPTSVATGGSVEVAIDL